MGQSKGHQQPTSSPLRKSVNQKGPATVSLSTVSASPSRSPNYASNFDHDLEGMTLRFSQSITAAADSQHVNLDLQTTVREDGTTGIGVGVDARIAGVGRVQGAMYQTVGGEKNASVNGTVTGALSNAGAGVGDVVETNPAVQDPSNSSSTAQNVVSDPETAEEGSENSRHNQGGEGAEKAVDLTKPPNTTLGVAKASLSLSPKIEKVSDPKKLDSPRMPVARINAIWNKWLHAYASSSQYVEAAVHRHYVTRRDIPDLVVCTQDSEYKATWKIVFGGFPGKNSAQDTGPMETQWIPIRDHMKGVCIRHKPEQSPTHAITAFGRWVRFWEIQEDGSLFPVTISKSAPKATATAGPNVPKEQTYASLDIGDEESVKVIDAYMQSIFSS